MTQPFVNSEFGVFWGEDLYKCDTTKKPLIDNILYEKDVVCISALPGVGKSILALQILCSLTSGDPLFGAFEVPEPKNVLYIQTEGDRVETIERLSNMKKALKIDDSRWVHVNLSSIAINIDRSMDALLSMADVPKMKYDVVILDPLYTTVKGSMSQDDVATAWICNIRRLREMYQCAFIALHHEGKDSYHDGQVIDKGNAHIFGSTFWSAFFNSNYKFKGHPNGMRTLELGKERSGKMIDKITLTMIEPSPLYYKLGEHVPASTDRVKAILAETGEWTYLKTIVEKSGMSRATVYRALADLKKFVDKRLEDGVAYYRIKGEV